MAFTAGPMPISDDLQIILRAVWRVLEDIEGDSALILDEVHEEPLSPPIGLIVFADGTDWDPGSGRGLYRRDTSSWEAL